MTCSIAFSADSQQLWAVAEANRLDCYELLEGQLLQQVEVGVGVFEGELLGSSRGRESRLLMMLMRHVV